MSISLLYMKSKLVILIAFIDHGRHRLLFNCMMVLRCVAYLGKSEKALYGLKSLYPKNLLKTQPTFSLLMPSPMSFTAIVLKVDREVTSAFLLCLDYNEGTLISTVLEEFPLTLLMTPSKLMFPSRNQYQQEIVIEQIKTILEPCLSVDSLSMGVSRSYWTGIGKTIHSGQNLVE